MTSEDTMTDETITNFEMKLHRLIADGERAFMTNEEIVESLEQTAQQYKHD